MHADAGRRHLDGIHRHVQGNIQPRGDRLRQHPEPAAQCQRPRPPRREQGQRERERFRHPFEGLEVEAFDDGAQEVLRDAAAEEPAAPRGSVLAVEVPPRRIVAQGKSPDRPLDLRATPAEPEPLAPGQRAADGEAERVCEARPADLATADERHPRARLLHSRIQRDLADQRQQDRVRTRQELRAAVDDKAVDLVARHPTADAAGGLEHANVESPPREGCGRGQPRDPRSDDDNLGALHAPIFAYRSPGGRRPRTSPGASSAATRGRAAAHRCSHVWTCPRALLQARADAPLRLPSRVRRLGG